MSQAVLEYVPSVITKEMNLFLSRDFDTSEVATALQQMTPLKAPGSYGMPHIFTSTFGVR